MEQAEAETFEPQFSTRDGDDTRVAIVLHSIHTLVLTLLPWFGFNYGLWRVLQTATNTVVFPLLAVGLFNLFLSYRTIVWGLRNTMLRLKFADEGIYIERAFNLQLIPWEEIDQVEPFSRWEMIKVYFDPRAGGRLGRWQLAIPPSITFKHYVRIRHKTGVILFPPKNRPAFLRALSRWRERKQQGQTETTVKPTPWYVNAAAETEQTQQTVRSRVQD
jgi:hypothetical protein